MEQKCNTVLEGKMPCWKATTQTLHSLLQTAAACCMLPASFTYLLAHIWTSTPGTLHFCGSGSRDNRSLYSFQLKNLTLFFTVSTSSLSLSCYLEGNAATLLLGVVPGSVFRQRHFVYIHNEAIPPIL